MRVLTSIVIIATIISCKTQSQENNSGNNHSDKVNNSTSIIPGASQLEEYLPLLEGKNVAMLVNQTSTIANEHLVDTLLTRNVNITKIYAPEHGFRGDSEAGEHVVNGIDVKTGLPIISLYGANRKPSVENMKGIDIVIFDIQDVGARFYTYISSMHYVMEACAENNVPLLILDRPNPNGHYVDGPVLDTAYRSFVGMHPIPVVRGLTVAELAKMINGEKWLANGEECSITTVRVENYNHNTPYNLPISPSPNLPNNQSILLYPSICFFEPTIVSIGRGTEFPFQVIGYPKNTLDTFEFTPVSIKGKSLHPKHENVVCTGQDLRKGAVKNEISLKYLLSYFKQINDPEKFFTNTSFFDKLAGGKGLREAIVTGKSEKEIRASWESELEIYKGKRKKYLLYEDFSN